jgi:hypothetical protein
LHRAKNEKLPSIDTTGGERPAFLVKSTPIHTKISNIIEAVKAGGKYEHP